MAALTPLWQTLRALGSELLAPERCVACPGWRGPLCPGCAPELALGVRVEPGVVVGGRYAGPLRQLILRLKGGRSRPAARAIAGLLAPALEEGPAYDGLVPVPSAAGKGGWREDPAVLLAEELRGLLGVPLRPVLERRQGRPAQKELSGCARRANARGLFRVRGTVEGRLLLVDDVRTTGSTIRALVSSLLTAGAAEVRAAVGAHQPLYGAPGRREG